VTLRWDTNTTIKKWEASWAGLVSLDARIYRSTPGLTNAAPVIYFPAALFYSGGFNVNQNIRGKIFLNNSMFQFFSQHSHEHGLPAFAILFSFVPILLPPNPTLSFFTGESAGISSHPFKQITHLGRLCFEGPVNIIVGVS
jgi:hypothetical protein